MSKRRSGLFNDRRAYRYDCCTPPRAAIVLVDNNYSYCNKFLVAGLTELYTEGGVILCINPPPIVNTNNINFFYISEYDDNGSQFIP